MDTRKWFDEGTYSDLTVKLSDGAEIKVQKIIVCRANEYFRKLCGPDSRFAVSSADSVMSEYHANTATQQENKQKTIELKEDDPTALRNVLRSIYELPMVADKTGKEDWRVSLNLHQTADKYLESSLSQPALDNFRFDALGATNSDTIFDIVEAINSEMAHDEDLVDFGEKLRKDNIGILLKNDRYRAQLDKGGKEAVWQQLDELIFAAVLKKKRYYLCDTHCQSMFQEPSIGADEETTDWCTVCKCSSRGYSYGSEQHLERTAWLPK
jgi:hypothetical protein